MYCIVSNVAERTDEWKKVEVCISRIVSHPEQPVITDHIHQEHSPAEAVQ